MRGFTLIEITVVSAIILLLGAAGTAAFFSFWKNQSLSSGGQSVLQALDLARAKTLSSASADSYGVAFNASSDFILFRGANFNPADPNNIIKSLPDRLEFVNIDLGGGTSVFFERLTGYSSSSGSVVIRDKRDAAQTITVYVYSSGEASLAPPEADSGGRITDTRHLHFNLGWSIWGAATLRFAFNGGAGPNIDVGMAPYFNGDQTVFIWEGDLDAGGDTERFRVESHELSGADALLSVIRSRDVNNLPAEIIIDGKSIVSYAADGTASAGIYGGTMEIR